MDFDPKRFFEGLDSLIGERGVVFLSFLSLLTLGPLEIFVADPKLFADLDTFKLIVLSLAFTLPPFLLAAMAFSVYSGKTVKDTPYGIALAVGTASAIIAGAGGIAVTASRHSGFWPYFISQALGVALTGFLVDRERRKEEADKKGT